MIPERIKEDFERKRDEMVADMQRTTLELAEFENKVRGVLGDEPVPAMDYLKYYNFMREVYKAKNRYSGGYALTTEVQILVDKWVARQAIKRILEKIRDELFSIPAP
jgi:hypothetical protein